MSSDYYFNKWKKTLSGLEILIELDLEFQKTQVHDQKCCDAATRLSGILGRYIAYYNDALECQKNNLQVQKTVYITEVVKTIVARILELKEQLRKLEGAYFQFLSNGLIEHKLTPSEAEFSDVPTIYERPEETNKAIKKAFERAIERNEAEKGNEVGAGASSEHSEDIKWWEESMIIEKTETKKLDMTKVYEVKEKISKEALTRKHNVAIIQAHEKTRQITLLFTKTKQRREKWAKELKGILNSPARIEIRERGSKLIQKCLRYYYELKRKRLNDCQRDELLQLRLCNKPYYKETLKEKEIKIEQVQYKKYENLRRIYNEEFKNRYFKRKYEDIAEEIRDYVRDWFRKWYDEVQYFYNIPNEKQGGSILILKEEVLSPAEWKEKCKAYLESKKANKYKTYYQLKLEKQEAKEEELMLQRERIKRKKLEADLLKKMMKNPTLHPGFKYPASKKTELLINAIMKYQKNWHKLDKEEITIVKEKFVENIDVEQLCMEVKLNIHKIADVDMRGELKLLKRALKEDYKRNEEQMPESMKEKTKRKKKHKRIILTNENNYDKLTDLAVTNVLKEYPHKDFKEYLGDANFAGDDIRYMLRPALHFGAEIRAAWWESCREVIHGFKRILLLGPKGSGKTTLVQIMATVSDAILYELNPVQVIEKYPSSSHLQQLINTVAKCARETQPSVIHIKDVQKLYYRKVSSEENNGNFDMMKRFFIRKLFKKINHRDHVTIIGTCTDPWLTKSQQLLKRFPKVLLLPDTSYSVVYLILSNWVLSNRIVPSDLDIHSLAYVLQGYSFGYLTKALDDFLTADRIVKIAAYGLTPQTIYEYIISNENESKNDYARYLKWYAEKTRWGKLESKRLQEDKEFRALGEEWKEKMNKKKQNRQKLNKIENKTVL